MKTYKTPFFSTLSLAIGINGIIRHIEFDGGRSNPFLPGSYHTSSKEEQKALESHPDFGSLFVLASVNENVPEKTENTEPEETQEKQDKGPTAGIITVQAAKEYIKTLHPEIPHSKLTNKAMVLEVAASLDITFPDLPTE
jgi:hypothetical protein